MLIKDLRKQTKLSQKQFCKMYRIPLKTLQSWEAYEKGTTSSESRKPTDWTYYLLEKAVNADFSKGRRD